LETWLNWIALISGLGGLIVVLWKFVFTKGYKAKALDDMQEDIKGIREELDKLTKKVGEVDLCANEAMLKIGPFWHIIETNLPLLLNVSHSENLITKLAENRISDEELEHLEKEVKLLLIQDKDVSGKVFVDLMALWAIEVRRSERSTSKICPVVEDKKDGI
jgi:hypothetical protein